MTASRTSFCHHTSQSDDDDDDDDDDAFDSATKRKCGNHFRACRVIMQSADILT